MPRLSKKAQRLLGANPQREEDSARLEERPESGDPVETLLGLLQKRRDAGVSPQELAEFPDWAIVAIEAKGHEIRLKGGRIVLERDNRTIVNPDAAADNVFDPRRKSWKFALISDNHFGGKQAQPWFVREVFQEAERRGCSAIFDCGDDLDGSPKMHAGFVFELVLRSAQEQVDFTAEVLGESQVPIYGVGGNHPGSWFKDSGINTSRMLAERLDNYTDLGPIEGWVAGPNDDPNFMLLHHPGDGTSYAISYKPQKLAEYLVTENRRVPTGFCAIGHYHKRGWFTGPNGAMFMMVPATCGTTSFMLAKKLVNESGAYFIEFSIDKDGKVDRFILEHKALWPHQWRSCDYSDFLRPKNRKPATGNVWG